MSEDNSNLLNDPAHVRADARLIQRAIRERWPIPDEFKRYIAAAIADKTRQALDSNDDRKFISLAKLCLEMERQNVYFGLAMLEQDEAAGKDFVVIELPEWSPSRTAAAALPEPSPDPATENKPPTVIAKRKKKGGG